MSGSAELLFLPSRGNLYTTSETTLPSQPSLEIVKPVSVDTLAAGRIAAHQGHLDLDEAETQHLITMQQEKLGRPMATTAEFSARMQNIVNQRQQRSPIESDAMTIMGLAFLDRCQELVAHEIMPVSGTLDLDTIGGAVSSTLIAHGTIDASYIPFPEEAPTRILPAISQGAGTIQ